MSLPNDEAGDEVHNATIHWPEERQQLEIGTLALTAPVPDDPQEQKHIIFDPIPPRRWNRTFRRSAAGAAGRRLSHRRPPRRRCARSVEACVLRYCWASMFIPMLALSFSVD